MTKREKDRNHDLGGRSFYFFDFDDNIAILQTPCVLFHQKNNSEVFISTHEFARNSELIGRSGKYQSYEVRHCSKTGSFRFFRDSYSTIELNSKNSEHPNFISDLRDVMTSSNLKWQGPSWSCFYHATFNQRPISIITARGHSVETLRLGVREMVKLKHLPFEPNFLSLFPVNNPDIRLVLGDGEFNTSVSEMKQRALRASVEAAFLNYGESPHHRFGVSDDDPKNLQLLWEELIRLKARFPENSFFMIETHGGQFLKKEVPFL